MAAHYNTNSVIYEYSASTNRFEELQSIATKGAMDWESILIGDRAFLAVANYYDGSTYNINSVIYDISVTTTPAAATNATFQLAVPSPDPPSCLSVSLSGRASHPLPKDPPSSPPPEPPPTSARQGFAATATTIAPCATLADTATDPTPPSVPSALPGKTSSSRRKPLPWRTTQKTTARFAPRAHTIRCRGLATRARIAPLPSNLERPSARGAAPANSKTPHATASSAPTGTIRPKETFLRAADAPRATMQIRRPISIISAGDEGGGASSSSTNATIRDSCTACPRGMYGDAEAALIKAIACAPCAAGRYSELEGVATTAENTPVQEMCMACPRGRWSDTPGQDTEALCRLCGPGRYGSGSSTAGAASNTSCAPCPGGKFSVAVGSWGENKTCGACPVGFHQNVEGQAFCLPCLPGQFGNESGLRKCFECAAGQYRSAGDEDDDDTTASCDACPKGYYQGSAGRASCLPCLPGLFGNVSGLVECQACPSGKVSKDQNASVCADCDPGESSSATGSASCTACGAGQFSSISGGDCEECAEGRYRVQAKDPTKNDPTKCTACPKGYYQGSAGRASCLPCLPGTFSDTPGLISCMACKTGQFQSEVNATQCKDIKEGHISGPDRSSQIQIALGFRAINCANIKGNGTQTCADTQKCPEGTRGATPVATPQCVPCGQGKTSPGGSTTCATCDKGKYGATAGGLCAECPAGQYQDTSGQSKCLHCPTGWSQPNRGTQACLQDPGLTPEDCGDTQYLNNPPQLDDYQKWSCEPCPQGGLCRGPVQWSDIVCPPRKSKIKALFGWSRCAQNGSSAAEYMFERCPFAAACLGAPNVNLENKFEDGVAMHDREEGCNIAYRNASSSSSSSSSAVIMMLATSSALAAPPGTRTRPATCRANATSAPARARTN